MKRKFPLQFLVILFVTYVLPAFAQAQDSTGVTSAVAAETAWYSETWVWTVGGIISILFILALVRWSTNKRRGDESAR